MPVRSILSKNRRNRSYPREFSAVWIVFRKFFTSLGCEPHEQKYEAIKPDLAGERKAQLWTNVWSAMLFLACRSFPQLFAQLSPIVPNSSQPFPAFSPKSFEIAPQSFPKPPPNLPKTTQNPSKRLLGAYLGLKKSQKHFKSTPRAPQELPRAPPRGPTPSQTLPKGSPRPPQTSFLSYFWIILFLNNFCMDF